MRFGSRLLCGIVTVGLAAGLSLSLVGCTSEDAESAAVNVWDTFASIGDGVQTAISNISDSSDDETAADDTAAEDAASSEDSTNRSGGTAVSDGTAETDGTATEQTETAESSQAENTDETNTQATTSASRLQKVTIDYVSDGDTMNVLIDGVSYRVRLIGVDTPESKHYDETLNTEEGVLAGEHTKALLPKGTTVWIEKDTSEYDRYGRLLRYVWLEEPDDPDDPEEVRTKMLNAILVEDGWATAKSYWPDTKWKDLFAQLQEEYELSLQQEAS